MKNVRKLLILLILVLLGICLQASEILYFYYSDVIVFIQEKAFILAIVFSGVILFLPKKCTKYLRFVRTVDIKISGEETFVEIYRQEKIGKAVDIFSSISKDINMLCLPTFNEKVNDDNEHDAVFTFVQKNKHLFFEGTNKFLLKSNKIIFCTVIVHDGSITKNDIIILPLKDVSAVETDQAAYLVQEAA